MVEFQETDPDAWKPKPEVNSSLEELGIGLRPQVKIEVNQNVSQLIFPNRDKLLKQKLVFDGLLAYVEKTDEWFKYSLVRNFWMRIKKV